MLTGVMLIALAIAAESLPQMIAPGVVSTDAIEFGTALSPDGKTMYFNRVIDGRMQLWRSVRRGDEWTDAARLSFGDPRYNDIDPFVSRSGDRLYFSSNRPRPGSTDPAAKTDYDIWYATRTSDGWSAPVHGSDAINSDRSEIFASEDRQGRLYFARSGVSGGDPPILMVAVRQSEGFASAEAVKVDVGAAERLSNPAISADGLTLVISGRGPPPIALWQSRKASNGTWSKFTRIDAAILDAGSVSFAPYQSNDGKSLYFTGERAPVAGADRGQRDLYSVPFRPAK